MTITKLDIVEAILGPTHAVQDKFTKGQVLFCLFVSPFPSKLSTPLIIRRRGDTGGGAQVLPLVMGTSKEEVKKRVIRHLDSFFDGLKDAGWREYECVECGYKFIWDEGDEAPACPRQHDMLIQEEDGSLSEVFCGGETKLAGED